MTDSFGLPRTIEIPELIESTNLLRLNEHLKKTNDKKSELIEAYTQYTNQLENLLSSVFEIQNELKDLLKDQTELISKSSSRSKVKNSQKKGKNQAHHHRYDG